jgi:hypothetical protein
MKIRRTSWQGCTNGKKKKRHLKPSEWDGIGVIQFGIEKKKK